MITLGRDMFWGSPGVTLAGNSLIFPNTLSDYEITLWSGFEFGIQSFELKYITNGSHNFYNGTTRVVSIDGSGNLTWGNLTANGALYDGSTTVLNGTTYIGGKLGIYNSSPLYDLDVNGFINCNHTVYSGVLSASTYILHICH